MSVTVDQHIETRGVENTEELQRAHELMAGNHDPEYADALRMLTTTAKTYPGMQPEHTRIAYFGDDLAGALRIFTDTIRIGEARLKMGGIGWVTTSPDFRKRGVASALMRDALRFMGEHGYHVSMLFGIPNFYTRFGYTTTLAEHFVSVRTEDIPPVPVRRYRARPIKPGEIRYIQRIHDTNDHDVACSLLRNGAHLGCRWERIEEAWVFLTEHGRLDGYAWPQVSENALEIREVGEMNPNARREILAWCAREAEERLHHRIRFAIPPEHPFARYLSEFPSRHETRLVKDRDGMMAVVDVGETLENMIPEWESRMRPLAIGSGRAELTLLVDNKPYRIRSNRGTLDVAPSFGRNKFSLASTDLIRLITGYDHWEDIYHRERRLVSEDGRDLIAALFPKRNPYVHPFDRF